MKRGIDWDWEVKGKARRRGGLNHEGKGVVMRKLKDSVRRGTNGVITWRKRG